MAAIAIGILGILLQEEQQAKPVSHRSIPTSAGCNLVVQPAHTLSSTPPHADPNADPSPFPTAGGLYLVAYYTQSSKSGGLILNSMASKCGVPYSWSSRGDLQNGPISTHLAGTVPVPCLSTVRMCVLDAALHDYEVCRLVHRRPAAGHYLSVGWRTDLTGSPGSGRAI